MNELYAYVTVNDETGAVDGFVMSRFSDDDTAYPCIAFSKEEARRMIAHVRKSEWPVKTVKLIKYENGSIIDERMLMD